MTGQSLPVHRRSSLASATVVNLAGTQRSVAFLEKSLDHAAIPFVRRFAEMALEVIKTAMQIRENQENRDNLVNESASLLVVILTSFTGKTENHVPDHLRNEVEQLTTTFDEVLEVLKIIHKREGERGALLYYFDNDEKLRGCLAKLVWAMQEFEVTSKIDSGLADLLRYEELHSQAKLHESQQGTAKMTESTTIGPESMQELQKGQAEIRISISDHPNSWEELQKDRAEIGKSVTEDQNDERLVEQGGKNALKLDSGMEGTKEVAVIIESRTLTTDAPSDLQMATNIDTHIQSDGVDQTLNVPKCEDCQRYREQLLENQLQIRALSDQILQEREKGARGLFRWFSSITNMNTTTAGYIQSESEIRECKPDHRGETVYPSKEDLGSSSRCCCVIQ
ncbi:hypothetical protein FRC03_003857 [Tulasnella sp. 419]|nr:hypothetical protein FRC03_003857 [Tulasnella sp. 419]